MCEDGQKCEIHFHLAKWLDLSQFLSYLVALEKAGVLQYARRGALQFFWLTLDSIAISLSTNSPNTYSDTEVRALFSLVIR